MKIKKNLASFMIGVTFITSLSGCTLPFVSSANNRDDSEISYIAFENKATSTDEIVNYITAAMENNQNSCEIFVPSEDLIDANVWLQKISGIEQIQCEYRMVKDGFNMVVTYECWDNYAIMKAFDENDTSSLNERQLELYNKYLEILDEITSPKNSDYENELAVHDYLVKNVTYIENEERNYNAYDALIKGEAVCSGYTECFKTFMDMLGIENYTISGEAGNQQHIWNVVKLDGEWYQVDVTWDDPVGSNSDYIEHAYFNISDEDMALDHKWESDMNKEYPATGTEYSYTNQAKLATISTQYALDNLIYRAIHNRQDHIVFCMTENLDLKSSVSYAGVKLSYSYKTTKRSDYTLYSVSFNY